MFENIINFFKNIGKKEDKKQSQENSKNTAKERLHLVLMQDRANVSADFLELMKQEIIDVIKKYIEIDEKEIDVRLTNKENEDGTNGAPALYANIPILNIKNDSRKINKKEVEEIKEEKEDYNPEEIKQEEQVVNEQKQEAVEVEQNQVVEQEQIKDENIAEQEQINNKNEEETNNYNAQEISTETEEVKSEY